MRRIIKQCLLVCLFGSLLPLTVAGAEGSPAISQGFETDEKTIPVGSLVSFQKDVKHRIRLANTEQAPELAGVVADRSLIEIGEGKLRVQVVTNGTTNALVSDINGDIKSGDKIAASPINGVGMKSFGGTQIVGIAQADLSSVKTVQRQVKDRSGAIETVKIGSVPLQVNVSYFDIPDDQKTVIPSFLQQMANSIAGKEVPVIRVVLAIMVLLLGFVSIGVILYASVRSSIISIGRNPLSEGAVQKSLLTTAGMAVGILLVMLSTIYLILTV